LVYDLEKLQANRKKNKKQLQEKIWTFTKVTAWRKVKDIMEKAGITGQRACPKGLRHAFAIYAITEKNIPITTVQKWLGHAYIETTAIYANPLGAEERKLASRLWE